MEQNNETFFSQCHHFFSLGFFVEQVRAVPGSRVLRYFRTNARILDFWWGFCPTDNKGNGNASKASNISVSNALPVSFVSARQHNK
jgi:hypothetical protein